MLADILSIEEAFGDLRDPHCRMLAHDVTQMLMVALRAILSGANSGVAIKPWAEVKLGWLRRYLQMVNG